MNRSLRSKLYMGICNDRSTFPASRKTLTFCTLQEPSWEIIVRHLCAFFPALLSNFVQESNSRAANIVFLHT